MKQKITRFIKILYNHSGNKVLYKIFIFRCLYFVGQHYVWQYESGLLYEVKLLLLLLLVLLARCVFKICITAVSIWIIKFEIGGSHDIEYVSHSIPGCDAM